MNFEALEKSILEDYKNSYEENIEQVRRICKENYRSDWQVLARTWGETDDQGLYKQFYFFYSKLEYHLNKRQIK
jgi:hypothetical protein